MTRGTLAACVATFDRLRPRVGADAAMEQAIEVYRRGEAHEEVLNAARSLPSAALAIVGAVAKSRGLTTADLRRGRVWSVPSRDEAVYVVRAVVGVSFPVLARYFRKDSSTLVFGQRRFEKRLEADQVLAARVARVIGGEAAAEERAVAA